MIRLFAAAREAAGTATDEVPGVTVDEVLDAARARYGPEFAVVLAASRVWCNGEPATGDQPVGPADEVAVLPPVSGGSGPPTDPDHSSHRRSPVGEGGRPAPARPARPAGPARSGRTAPSARSAPSGRPTAPTRSTSRPEASPAPRVAAATPGPDTTALRTVPVPIPSSGEVVVRGRPRPVVASRHSRTAIGRRYGVVYDTGPWKVTLGVVWFLALLASLAVGWVPLTALFGVTAGWAGLDVARRRQEVGEGPDAWVAGLGAGAVGAAGAAGAFYVGGALLALVVAAVVVATTGREREHVLAHAGSTVLSSAPFGLAAACVVLTHDLEIGAVVVLVLLASAYDARRLRRGLGGQQRHRGPGHRHRHRRGDGHGRRGAADPALRRRPRVHLRRLRRGAVPPRAARDLGPAPRGRRHRAGRPTAGLAPPAGPGVGVDGRDLHRADLTAGGLRRPETTWRGRWVTERSGPGGRAPRSRRSPSCSLWFPSGALGQYPSAMAELEERWRDLGEFIREQRHIGHLSLRKLSEMAGVSNPYLSQIERGLRKPSAEILQQIARALEISSETLYVRAGILEERPDEADLVGEIRRDPWIDEEQKRTLIQIYESFRSATGGGGDAARRAARAEVEPDDEAPPESVGAAGG